jgi:hypothetical protein
MFFCRRMADRPPELTPWGVEGIDQKGLNRRQQFGAQPTRIHHCPQPKAATTEDGGSRPSTYKLRFSLCAGSSLPNRWPADGLEGRVKVVVTISAPVANCPGRDRVVLASALFRRPVASRRARAGAMSAHDRTCSSDSKRSPLRLRTAQEQRLVGQTVDIKLADI